MQKEKIDAYFEGREAELVDAVSRLVRIPSVKGEARPGMPFGEGPDAALREALAMAGEMGFEVSNIDGYVGTADLNDKDTSLHILAHLDVVVPGAGWTVTEPFAPRLADGMLYGRGTDDDKGPLVAVLLAMRAARELGAPLKHNVKLIMGTDEESGSADIAYYYGKHPYAAHAFTPDASFPVINVEKGFFRPVFAQRWAREDALPRVCALSGGELVNVIPSAAQAVVLGMEKGALDAFCQEASRRTGARFALTEEGGGVRIEAEGTGGHAAYPEGSNNALTALLSLLSDLPLAGGPSKAALSALASLFPHGDTAGKGLGISMEDEISGPLTLVLSILNFGETGFEARYDSRVPLCATEQNCRQAAFAALAAHGFEVTAHDGMEAAHNTPADAPFVQTLLRCYRQYTGREGKALSTGGGTYVHNIPGGVAFGAGMPGFESNLHGPDERVSVADLLTACKIFTQAILDLCG